MEHGSTRSTPGGGHQVQDTQFATNARAALRAAAAWRLMGPVGHFARLTLPPLAVAVVAVVAWHLWVEWRDIPPYLLPKPGAVATRFVDDWDALFHAFRATALAALLGFVAAIVVGFAVAVLFSQSRVIQRSLYPFAIILQTTPIIALAPLIIIWVGYGQNSIVVIAFIITLFPIIANSTLGLISVEHNLVNLFRMNNASRFQELWKLRIPYSMPFVVAGLKVSAGLSVIGAIVGEFFAGQGGSQSGLGAMITFSAYRLQTDLLVASALCASLLGIAFFTVVTTAGNYMVRNWHESATTHEN